LCHQGQQAPKPRSVPQTNQSVRGANRVLSSRLDGENWGYQVLCLIITALSDCTQQLITLREGEGCENPNPWDLGSELSVYLVTAPMQLGCRTQAFHQQEALSNVSTCSSGDEVCSLPHRVGPLTTAPITVWASHCLSFSAVSHQILLSMIPLMTHPDTVAGILSPELWLFLVFKEIQESLQ
jgi:hypothetical protein